MTDSVRFETPENISVSYRIAGLGSRFVAWLFDLLLIAIGTLGTVLVFFLVFTLFSLLDVFERFVDSLGALALAFFIVVNGFVYVGYFVLFELFMQGQTPGKRSVQIRTVMAGGFSLTPAAIVIRNLFRVIESFPLFWFVPLVAKNSQRFGDMVAGTLVVADSRAELDGLHNWLLSRSADSIRFSFTTAELERLREDDVKAVTTYLQRQKNLDPKQSAALASRLTQGVVRRLRRDDPPASSEQTLFLMDLLTARLRKDLRELG